MLGWAVDLTTSDSDARASAGFAALRALGGSDLLQPVDAPMLRDLLDATLADLAQAYPEKNEPEEGADVGA